MWDDTLAHGARAWANKCNFEHQHVHNQGENLYYAAPRTHSDDYYIQRALAKWTLEKTHNQGGNFDCCFHRDYDCCHYTQVRLWVTKDEINVPIALSAFRDKVFVLVATVLYYTPQVPSV